MSQATVLGSVVGLRAWFCRSIELKPHLFFFDPDIWATVLKLKAIGAGGNRRYQTSLLGL